MIVSANAASPTPAEFNVWRSTFQDEARRRYVRGSHSFQGSNLRVYEPSTEIINKHGSLRRHGCLTVGYCQLE